MTTHPTTKRNERFRVRLLKNRPKAWKMDRIETDVNCPHCQHPGNQHFSATDEIGYWAFCMWTDCDCFLDIQQP